jgi:hypothetical protein
MTRHLSGTLARQLVSYAVPLLMTAAITVGTTGLATAAEPSSIQIAQAKGGDDLLLKGGDDLLLKGGDDLLLKGGDDLLKGAAPAPKASGKTAPKKEAAKDSGAAHNALFAESRFPSAGTCGTCHPKQYSEWSVSQHSYSQLSPVYMAINNFINSITSGSNGDFCLRCHTPVGSNLGESPAMSNLDRHPTSREGITCVVCHRMDRSYNKASGRLALVEGDLLQPVYGAMGNDEMARVLKNTNKYRVITDPKKAGRKIHVSIKKFAPLSQPIFCGTCHDVTLFNGFRLEEAYSEYRTSPAAARGVTCNDCHMGKIQGKVSGYQQGPAAMVGGVPTANRKLASHFFAGPDYSVIHPGIFPHNAEAQQLATMRAWLKFDYKAGWGTEKFEDKVTKSASFPKEWKSVDDRYDAREILNVQFKRLELMHQKRLEVLRNGYLMTDIKKQKDAKDGLEFTVQVENGTDGHNVPTGFTGERVVFLQVNVTDATGKVIFKSGDRDPNGDLRDHYSAFVRSGDLPLDSQLFSLQSHFVVQAGRGAERERVIPIPYPVTSLPRVLPAPVSLIFTGEPPTERNHRKGIEPLGKRIAKYTVDASKLTGKGPYKANIKLISQMAPANLIGAIQSVGFDYGLSPGEIVQRVAAGADVLWEKNVTFGIGNVSFNNRGYRGKLPELQQLNLNQR